jgi:flagellar basal-body rod protein FlgC
MSMSAFGIAVTGMRAATARLEAASANIANAQSGGAVPGTDAPAGAGRVFQPVRVQQYETGGQGGVGFDFSRDSSAYIQAYDPTSPDANGKGMVALPAVDMATEALNLITAKLQYSVSAKVARVASDMQRTALDTLA